MDNSLNRKEGRRKGVNNYLSILHPQSLITFFTLSSVLGVSEDSERAWNFNCDRSPCPIEIEPQYAGQLIVGGKS